MTLILKKLSKFAKNNMFRIVIFFIILFAIVVILLSMFSANKKILDLIDKNEKDVDRYRKKIEKNNLDYTKAKIQFEIKNEVASSNKEELLIRVNAVVSSENMSDYEKNKELNKIHESIKRFK